MQAGGPKDKNRPLLDKDLDRSVLIKKRGISFLFHLEDTVSSETTANVLPKGTKTLKSS